MSFWVVLVPLPIAFIHPMRGGGCLWLLLFGWAIILATFASNVISAISKFSTSIGRGAGVGATAGAIVGATAGRPRAAAIGAGVGAAVGVLAAKLSPRKLQALAIALLLLSVAMITQWENQHLGRIQGIFERGETTLRAIKSFSSLAFHPAPGSTILLKSTLPDKWTPLFIASLVWNDHSLNIWVDGQNELSPEQLAKVNYIIAFTESETTLLRGPESRQQR
jgi:hypothetical protein